MAVAKTVEALSILLEIHLHSVYFCLHIDFKPIVNIYEDFTLNFLTVPELNIDVKMLSNANRIITGTGF